MGNVIYRHIGSDIIGKDEVVWPCESMCSLVGGSVSVGVCFEVSEAQASPVSLSSCCL